MIMPLVERFGGARVERTCRAVLGFPALWIERGSEWKALKRALEQETENDQ